MDASTQSQWQTLWALYCPELSQEELRRCDWLFHSPIQSSFDGTSPVDFADLLARLYSRQADPIHRKSYAQFFTPPAIARFMAGWINPLNPGARVIDPGAGTGILIAALAEHLAQQEICREWHVIAYEADPLLRPATALALGYTRRWLKNLNISLEFQIEPEDFIEGNADRLRPVSLFDPGSPSIEPDLVIANPPYFKLPKTDRRVALLPEIVYGQPNIYALFMAAAAKLLIPGGQLIFITPRSFCAGPYFRLFRKWFFRTVSLQRLHLFASRTEAFDRDKILQENIILSAVKGAVCDSIRVSNSHGAEDLQFAQSQEIPSEQMLDLASSEATLNIPINSTDHTLRDVMNRWPNRLQSFGMDISTGPIVPFRTDALANQGNVVTGAPLLWLQHVNRMAVAWPLQDFAKPQQIRIAIDTQALLLPNTNYVLIRRFSPKEENCRITAAPYLKDSLPSEFIGVENHLNYIHRLGGSLTDAETIGLAAFLNSRWVDQYVRLSSGNTQVSATELRNLPLPSLERIQSIGRRLLESEGVSPIALINQVVGEELDLAPELSNGGPHMSKIEEAKDLLKGLGLPPAQRNEIAALTLLALAGLLESDPWRKAQQRSIRIHDIISFIEQNYHKRYAENTRETFRRQVLHQFEQARLVDLNPDDPTLPTNSPRTHYAISKELWPVLKHYGTRAGQRYLEKFKVEQGTLLEIYQQRRSLHLIPLKDGTGREYHLSPGKHNELQVIAVEQFAPRFAPGAKLLYLGDTAHKTLIMDLNELEKVGFPADKHNKLPDIVFDVPKKNWLMLVEVVTAHGPVSPKRYHELERLLASSSLTRIYVSIFPTFKEYLRHARNIAWETEIWIAEAPDHLIHYNGNKFLGPPRSPKR